MDGDGGNSKIEEDGATEGQAPDHGGWHSMTGLDAGGPLSPFMLLSPTRLLQSLLPRKLLI